MLGKRLPGSVALGGRSFVRNRRSSLTPVDSRHVDGLTSRVATGDLFTVDRFEFGSEE